MAGDFGIGNDFEDDPADEAIAIEPAVEEVAPRDPRKK